ncbi:ribonuclease R [uncultured Intestinimonas sp.]|uniref:ribonuclease R n=1 Tax=uncultured Intestinimonas sp. TaxID=1689265 RepID=UPI0026004447|nr:ribonuclease R [uncultured Intestinimonas sp.]
MTLEGIYQANARGFGFLTPDGAADRASALFVPPGADGGAWTGDRVRAETQADPKNPQRQAARVTAVLVRNTKTLIGAVERRGRETWLRPSSDRYPHAVKVVGRSAGKLRPGDKIAVAVSSYGSAKLPPMGALKASFGRDGTRQASVAAILYRYDIEDEFPAPVRAAAALAPEEVDPAARADRLDLRDRTVITIDGASSKDFDDAVSLERDEKGRWVLGVHIADVSHYVPAGSVLDLEAFHRGASVYFADRVVPMLPEELSNGICSLNPHVDRLALSCILTLDPSGAVLDHRIAKSVLRSTERMTYGDCNLLLEDRDPALAERYAHILPMLRDMAVLAKALERRRRSRGALDLETRECYIVCDEAGSPVDVRVREAGESEKLIESFMLAANECVAEHLQKAGLPCVYRVHEKPSEDKAAALRTMLAPWGFDLKEASHGALQSILDRVKGTPQAPAIHTMVLRSLMKAQYDPQNLGHFGLAAKYYCHFTSPIRRYPDLMVHRILTALLDGTLERQRGKLTAAVKRAAVQSSEREVAAMSAEREIEKCYLAEYMVPHVGEAFSGTVTGITKFGLFVGLENGVEGLLPVTALPDDRYEYDEARMTLTGVRTKFVYTFGMPLEVLCAAANPGSGQIDFTLPGEPGALPKVRSTPRREPAPEKRGRASRPRGRRSGGRGPRRNKR